MDETHELIERTERVLAHVEVLQNKIARLQGELSSHTEVLRERLRDLRQLATEVGELKGTPVREPAQRVVALADPSSIKDRRLSPRRKGNLVALLISNAQASSEPVQGWVVDRSQGGLGVLVDEAVPLGTILSVRPTKAKAQVPFRWIQVEVRSSRRQRNSWNLGCQFLEKLTWNDLRMFG